MIHTAEFYMDLTAKEFKGLKRKYNIENEKYYDFESYVRCDGIRMKMRQDYAGARLVQRVTLFVDCIKILNKAEIGIEDSNDIESIIKSTCFEVTGLHKKLKLSRIDYRYDAIIKDMDKRSLLFKMWNKNTYRSCYMKKVDVFDKGTKTSNASVSIRYDNYSKGFNLYDKEKEREARDEAIMPYEENVVRFEAQIRGRHIKYMNKKHNVEPSFKAYFTREKYNLYMEKVVSATIHEGNYYNHYHASKKIEASNYKEKDKADIKKFLTSVSSTSGHLSAMKEEYSLCKFKKILEQLKSLEINPIIIPKNYLITCIENPINDMLFK